MSHGQSEQDVSEMWCLRRAREQYGPLLGSCWTARGCFSVTWRRARDRVWAPRPALFPSSSPLDGEQERGRKLFLSGSEFGSGSTFLFPQCRAPPCFRSVFRRSAMWKILEHIAVKVMDGSPVRNEVGDGKKSASAPSFTRVCVHRRRRRWDYSRSPAEGARPDCRNEIMSLSVI